MAIVYLSLGSNVGDSFSYLKQAVHYLTQPEEITVARVSSIYETDPVGLTDQAAFLNMVVEVETNLSAEALLDKCLSVERKLGRKRVIRWGPRTIDLDILLYNADNMKTESLVIPHPRMHERSFVLIPLLDLNSSIIHPVLNEPIIDIQQSLGDQDGIRLWKTINEGNVSEFLETKRIILR